MYVLLSVDEDDNALHRSAADKDALSKSCAREHPSFIFVTTAGSISESSVESESLSGKAVSF